MGESLGEISPGAVVETRRRFGLTELFSRLIKEKPLGTIGGFIFLVLVLTGIFADVLAPYGYNEISLGDRLAPPSADYLLGTDQLGRDILSRIIYGARISLYVGLGGSALCVLVTVFIGVVSGFLGGKIDLIIQRFVDGFMSFPPLVLYLTIMALLGPGVGQVIIVLGILRGIRESRVVRGAIIGIKQNVYVEAAVAIGCRPGRIITRHLLPNIMAPIIIIFTVAIGILILSEAMLSFLGFGIPPPIPSWGGMVSGAGRKFMFAAPGIGLWPGLALALAVWGINMLGDAVRDLLDPRLRGGLGRYGGVKVKMKISKEGTKSK